VTVDEMKRLMQSRGYFVHDKEVYSVLDKMDKNKDGTISYAEFREELVPKSPQKRA
jgi:Ca2+-binding EF-hand superfamily protein